MLINTSILFMLYVAVSKRPLISPSNKKATTLKLLSNDFTSLSAATAT